MLAKIKRQFTSVLPISKRRVGGCINCGECCKMVYRCPFLKNKDGKGFCVIYSFRPLSCKKYPRTKSEHLTCKTCGFKFAQEENKNHGDDEIFILKLFRKFQKLFSAEEEV